MPRPQNPYIAGNPVGGGPAFVGRSDVLRAIYRVLRDPQHHGVVLYGQRRIGKTSILQQLVSSLAEQGPFRPVYFDLQDKARRPLGEVLVDLARAIADALGLAPPTPEDDPTIWFRSPWLPGVLASLPKGVSLVVLFDEFDVLADVRSDNKNADFFAYLRQLLAEASGRLRFVFVIGRNIEDLANIAQSAFKSLQSERVSLLAREDAEALIRMSEANATLAWDKEAIDKAWALTNGHPYLLQHLCWQVWERLHEDTDTPAQATADGVEAVIARTLETARNALGWLWDGLHAGGRVVASALAGAGSRPISQDELEEILYKSGVKVVMRDLRDAPHRLVDWDLVEPVAKDTYRFRVELLRQWIAKVKPLHRVQKELDHVVPAANKLYDAAEQRYNDGDLDLALKLLRETLAINPNHTGASELLADILFSQGDWVEARRLLEQLYENHPTLARARLVQVLMAQAEGEKGEDERLALLDRVLELHRKHPAAEAARQQIWRGRGDLARSTEQFQAAAEAYREAGADDLVKQVSDELRRRQFVALLRGLELLQQQGAYGLAFDEARKLAEQFPDLQDWSAELARLEGMLDLEAAYRRVQEASVTSDRESAIRAWLDVIALRPTYRDATARLHALITGVDIGTFSQDLERERCARADAERQRASAETELRELHARVHQLRIDFEKTTERPARRFTATFLAACVSLAFGGVGGLYSIAITADRNKLQKENASLQESTNQLKTVEEQLSIAQASFDKEKKRRERLADTGPLKLTDAKVFALVKDADGNCSELMPGTRSFPAGKTCYVRVDVDFFNNLAGIQRPQGPLCVKFIDPNGRSIRGSERYTVERQGPTECTFGVLLNTPHSEKDDEKSIESKFNDESITFSRPWGVFEGADLIYKTPGEYRIEFWWQGRKIGQTEFKMVTSGSH